MDWVNGKVVMIGFRASLAGNAWNEFVHTLDYSTLNPCLELINSVSGSKTIDYVINDEENYWDSMQAKNYSGSLKHGAGADNLVFARNGF